MRTITRFYPRLKTQEAKTILIFLTVDHIHCVIISREAFDKLPISRHLCARVCVRWCVHEYFHNPYSHACVHLGGHPCLDVTDNLFTNKIKYISITNQPTNRSTDQRTKIRSNRFYMKRVHMICPLALVVVFLDAISHLYKRVCPSVRRSVSPSITHELKPCKRTVFDQNYWQYERERIL